MKTSHNHKRKSSKNLVIWVSLSVVIIVGIITYFLFIKPQIDSGAKNADTQTLEVEDRPVGDINYDTPTTDEQNPTLDPATPAPVPGSAIPVSITYAGGSPLQVRVLINEVVATGTCKLEVSRGSTQVTTQTVNIFNGANSTTCQGFTVDATLLNNGPYKIIVTVSSDGRQGTSTKEITFSE